MAVAWLSALFIVSLGVGCASPVATAKLQVKTEILDAVRRYELAYVLQPGDVIEVFVNRHPEYSRKPVVRADGMIALPLLGDVKAAGLPPSELAEQITQRYAPRLNHPEVTVIVENPPEPMVYVVGQVAAPRPVPLRAARTLAQAIAHAGDAAKTAAIGNVSVVRLNTEGYLESITLEGQSELSGQPDYYMAMSTIVLKANDLVVVPESNRSQAIRALQDIMMAMAPVLNLVVLREVTK